MTITRMEEDEAPPRKAAPSHDGAAVASGPDRWTELAPGTVLIGNIGLILAISLLGVLLVSAWVLLKDRTYTASASFVPQTRSQTSNLAGLASQIGLRVPTADAGDSPDFYAELLRTREVLQPVIVEPYSIEQGSGNRSVALAQILDVTGDTDAEREYETLRELRRRLGTNVNQRTGVISFSITAPSAPLAYEIATRLINELNRFNLERRRSQASAEREFTQARLGEARVALRRAEDELQRFLQQHRAFSNSPELLFQRERLDREIMFRQQVYMMLAESFEQARIEEVRETPVITFLERPRLPVRPDSRGVLNKALLALVAGGLLGIGIAFLREYLRVVRRRSDAAPAAAAR
jgi:uncharacterized protein involved in exopolysaccharide biosynthesis